ncbi:6-phospho-beta-galactosidase [Enterococcus villorum]|uniref:6-phospho-beta-galactosidase n=1 Tax=Enterococcus villorum TaxID=112904 RepID=A0A1V8Y9J5_9ENTE|nr:6-phospho-beta-galactosidase [Enterococcus villorum]OQO69287.1 6-phospho-beta-galactosidase [Enterococcus villorum]OQO71950.1 6-phospho-beta-galactosidase [Enterococcus villorum]
MDTFPEQFIFGAATAAYQAEGAVTVGKRGKNCWDDYLQKSGEFDPRQASDFYNRYEEDLRLSHEFGINGLRLSIAWSRIFPNGKGEVDPAGVEFYHQLIDSCNKMGVTPFVTLHHFDTPEKQFKEGDWLSLKMVDAYVDFATFCFQEYGDKVSYWITINEPWSVVAGQYIIGHFPPNNHYQIGKAIQSMHNMMVAHARVVNIYKESNQKGEIGIVHILESKYSISEKEEDRKAAQKEHILANQFLLDATFNGEYSPETIHAIDEILSVNDSQFMTLEEDFLHLKEAAENIDFLGLNYYASHFLKHYTGTSKIHHNGSGKKGSSIFALKGVGERITNSAIPTTDWDWPIYPQGLEDMLLFIKKRYPNYKKIYITENGLGSKDQFKDGQIIDDERINYARLHLAAILRARKQGIKVEGYFMWSLMDMFSWTNGYNKRYGLFYVDFETQQRFPKKSAYWYKKISETKKLDQA